ncbi:MAG TPA: polyketide synthase [Pyrinomonadaceae bacterium]
MREPVLNISRTDSGVVCVVMQDRANKNAFSAELIRSLTETFDALARDARCKAVVLTGYDSYFSSGGTQRTLLELHETSASFNDVNIYGLALNCPVPVISAMQGHGIGGGFIMGLFADIVVLARESVYTANFMKYGFTPGMGATCVLPAKLGTPLAAEMLLTAASFRGAELQQRGVPFAVLPRKDVLPHALNLAEELADKPRAALAALKLHLTAGIRESLDGFIEREVAMHQQTIHEPQVRERIIQRFGK